MRRLLLPLFLILVLTACQKPDEEPEFKHVRNIKVRKITGQEVLLNAEAVFFNPNDMRMKLRDVDVDLFVGENKVGNIDQTMKMEIPAESDFIVPLDASFNLKEAGGLSAIMSVLGGASLKVRYKGHIKVTVHGLPFRVPVDYENEVRMR